MLLLVSHISDVLSQDATDSARIESFHAVGDLGDRQEVLVIHYLYGIVTNVDDVGEGRVMPPMRDQQVFLNLARFLKHHHDKLSEENLVLAVETMNLFCDTEDFQTYEDDYVGGPSDADTLESLGRLFLDRMADDYDQRRKIRSLLDLLSRGNGGK